MTEHTFFHGLLVAWFLASGAVLIYLLKRPAPYGRHTRRGFGFNLPAKLAWVLMELPAAAVMPACFFWAWPSVPPVAWVFLLLWEMHYLHRAFVFPMRLAAGSRPMPVVVVLSGIAFNLFNGYLNGRGLTVFGERLPLQWLMDTRFLGGLALFLLGMFINRQADRVLLELRRSTSASGEYLIPYGGLYRLVSCPNYLGEMLEWLGWAVLTWSWAGFGFFVWTTANLLPRALAHHAWYREKFPDYPRRRRAVIPFVL
jgi:3-oxo-5-alpha-steroid 4-dehydrogenase 1